MRTSLFHQAKRRKEILGSEYGKPNPIERTAQAILYGSAKTTPKTVLIGYDGTPNDAESLAYTLSWLHENGKISLAKRLQIFAQCDCDVYNMALLPERGDALDHIDGDTGLVIAFHLNFDPAFSITEPTDNVGVLGVNPLYVYNRNNSDLYEACMKNGATLICWGEQPKEISGVCIHPEGDGPRGYMYEPTPSGALSF